MKKHKTVAKILSLDAMLVYLRKKLPKNRRKFSRSSVYRMVAEKKFPKQVKIGASSYWRVKDLNAWITKLIDGE